MLDIVDEEKARALSSAHVPFERSHDQGSQVLALGSGSMTILLLVGVRLCLCFDLNFSYELLGSEPKNTSYTCRPKRRKNVRGEVSQVLDEHGRALQLASILPP